MKHLYNDWDAVVGRAKGLWAPRWRTASVGATTTTTAAAAITDGKIDADADNSAMVSGDGLSATAAVAGAEGGAAASSAEMGFDEKLPAAAESAAEATQEGAESAPGVEDDRRSFDLVGGDGKDGWGGRGSPIDVVVAKEDGEAGAGGAGGAAATTGDGEETVAVDVASEAGEVKSRWSRAAWSAVDVRSVQSRLSRMVDDTSARIRSNMVKVSVEFFFFWE